MESPRSAKRRKLDTIPESPGTERKPISAAAPAAAAAAPPSSQKTSSSTTKPSSSTTTTTSSSTTITSSSSTTKPPTTTTTETDKDDARDTIRVASVATPSSLNLTPSKPISRPAPTSASRGSNIGGLMARLNAKMAEQSSPQKSPVRAPFGPASTVRSDLADLEKKGQVKSVSQKLRETFEAEQLARAAKRKPRPTTSLQANGTREPQHVTSATASPVKQQHAPPTVKQQHAPPTVEKRRPGRPRKIVQEDLGIPDDDDGPVSPSKFASARKAQPRGTSPLLFHVNGTRQPQFTPRKVASSPLKPRPKTMIDLDVRPIETNASANLSISVHDLKSIQTRVLDQLQGRTHTPFVGLGDEYDKIATLVHQTIVAGESNSMLIIGARGTAKTAVVESILQEQTLKNPHLFHVVRLNGFIHTDDKIALRDIWRQLGKEMHLEDDAAAKNYADTLTTLLALLSHPEELGRSADEVTNSVIFILDEFDLFATHPRQTLLYNLFDIAQSRKAPIAVLGLTTRFDVAEQLEKRVKSRFSHRHVHLSLAKDLSSYRHICQNSLMSSGEQDISADGLAAWNAVLNDLFTQESFNTHLRHLYYLSKSVRAFQTSMLMAIATLPLSSTSSAISADTLLAHLSRPELLSALAPPDAKLAVLLSLSSLQLALVISAARLTIIHDTDVVSFALCYAEYVSLASKAKIAASAAGAMAFGATMGGRVWGKEVARGAWEVIVAKGLLLHEGGKGNMGFRVDVRLEEIGEVEGLELGGMAKWCKEI